MVPAVPPGCEKLVTRVIVLEREGEPITSLPAVMSSNAVIGTLKVDEPPTDTAGLLVLGNKDTLPVPAFIVLVVVLPKVRVSAVIVILLLPVEVMLDEAPRVNPPVPLVVIVGLLPEMLEFMAIPLLVPVLIMLSVPVVVIVLVVVMAVTLFAWLVRLKLLAVDGPFPSIVQLEDVLTKVTLPVVLTVRFDANMFRPIAPEPLVNVKESQPLTVPLPIMEPAPVAVIVVAAVPPPEVLALMTIPLSTPVVIKFSPFWAVMVLVIVIAPAPFA